MAKSIFRQVSLERLSSPEQLDQLLRVTTPAGWVSLVALAGLIAALMVWGFTGEIPTRVSGAGILQRSGGVFDIETSSSGRVKDIYYDPGDIVKRGQVVARIDQPELLQNLKNARATLADLQTLKEQTEKYGSRESRLESESMAEQRRNLENIIRSNQEKVGWLEKRIKSEKELLDDGLITEAQLESTKQELITTNQNIKESYNQIDQLDIRAVSLEAQKQNDLSMLRNKINEAGRTINGLQADLDSQSKVASPYTGRVLAVDVDEGTRVVQGQPILSIELLGNDIKRLEAVLYFPPGAGKKIKAGMTAQIAPATVEQAKYGYLLGLVTYVADYPSTTESMMKNLKNEGLVKDLSMGNAPLMVQADLIPDPKNISNYKWSSSQGPPVTLQTGTLCASSVVVERQRPISLVVPLLKEKLLGAGDAP